MISEGGGFIGFNAGIRFVNHAFLFELLSLSKHFCVCRNVYNSILSDDS